MIATESPPSPPAAVLAVFATQGFRKASMGDLAQAMGVTRQTLYNRFRTKDGVLDWAVATLAESHRLAALEALAAPGSPRNRLEGALFRWTGDLVPLLRSSPHGAEMMDRGMASFKRTAIDPNAAFEATLVDFLLEEGVSPNGEDARNLTFLLMVAVKGLLLKSWTAEDFRLGLGRVLAAALLGRR
jgi:AcrR family transcriptional regulator